VPLNADGTIPPTPDVGPLAGGTWNWLAEYSGDETNNPATSTCGDEEFFIGQGQGGITTMVEDEQGTQYPVGAEVEVDTVLRDIAVLDGVTPDAGGSVTFFLHQGEDCSGDPIFNSDPVPVVNGEVQGPSGTITFVDQGTYQWVAVYSGDENNATVSSTCGAETIVIVGIPSSVTTAMFTADDTPIANNHRVLAGTGVYDTATVTPEDATRTLTLALYNNANCSGTPIETFEDVPVGTESSTVTLDTPGVNNWVVTYSGDDRYAPSVSACSTETFFIVLQPTISTIMVDENDDVIADGATIPAGESVEITVTGTTDAADCGILPNAAGADASNEPEDAIGNNDASAEIEVLCPDIVVEKVAADTDLVTGNVVSFTIAVTNTGEGNAYDVVVTDPLPAGFNWDVTGEYAATARSRMDRWFARSPCWLRARRRRSWSRRRRPPRTAARWRMPSRPTPATSWRTRRATTTPVPMSRSCVRRRNRRNRR
jgi:uncharacterized repeat protein (TIGR01451 family)